MESCGVLCQNHPVTIKVGFLLKSASLMIRYQSDDEVEFL
jgi:hypothetical protein